MLITHSTCILWSYKFGHTGMSQNRSHSLALTSCSCSCKCLSAVLTPDRISCFYWKEVRIWVHNRLCITPVAHSSLTTLIYVSLISAPGLVWSVNVASGWPGYLRAGQSTSGSPVLWEMVWTERSCEYTSIVNMSFAPEGHLQGHVLGFSYLLAATYCQWRSKAQYFNTRSCLRFSIKYIREKRG